MTEFLLHSFLGTPVWFWLAFVSLVAALTAFDLGLLHKEDRVMGIGESLKLSAFYISIALAAVLVFIGSKIFVSDFLLDEGKFPPVVSLAVTFGLIAAGIAWSLWKTRDAATHR